MLQKLLYIVIIFQPYTQTVTSDEEEAAKKTEQFFTNNLTTKLTNIITEADDKIENLDKKIQQQQVRHSD